jgi:hypothetical protein
LSRSMHTVNKQALDWPAGASNWIIQPPPAGRAGRCADGLLPRRGGRAGLVQVGGDRKPGTGACSVLTVLLSAPVFQIRWSPRLKTGRDLRVVSGFGLWCCGVAEEAGRQSTSTTETNGWFHPVVRPAAQRVSDVFVSVSFRVGVRVRRVSSASALDFWNVSSRVSDC